MYKLVIALRYLLRRKIAYISIIAIAFGLMAMIVVNSVMDGFQLQIRESIYKIDGALRVAMKDPNARFREDHYERVVQKLQPLMAENGGPITATSKRIFHYAMANTTLRNSDGTRVKSEAFIRVIGIDPELERDVLPMDVLFGDVDNPDLRVDQSDDAPDNPFTYQMPYGPISTDPGIILGQKLAERLRLRRGDSVTLISGVLPQGDASLEDARAVSERFVVTGAFKSGRFDYDNEYAFCEGVVLQDVLGLPNDCQQIAVALVDQEKAGEVKQAIYDAQGGLEGPLRAETWEDRMRAFANALKFEKLAMLIVLACIIVVAGASICGILYMVVLEKTRDIGILLSMGATSRGIVGVFLVYGGMLGLIGSAVGLFLGIQVVENLNWILLTIEDQFNVELFPPDVYEFKELPTHYEMSEIALYGAATFLWCLLSSLLPALRAARLDPVKCLSYE